ncbi:MAG: hypothetical protein ABI772_08595 [Bacteroidota bacterium]
MIQLLLSFLLSIGWLSDAQPSQTTVVDLGNNTYGVVSVDETSCRKATFTYIKELDIFEEK